MIERHYYLQSKIKVSPIVAENSCFKKIPFCELLFQADNIILVELLDKILYWMVKFMNYN